VPIFRFIETDPFTTTTADAAKAAAATQATPLTTIDAEGGLGRARMADPAPRTLLALQLRFRFEMGAACFGLVSSSPE